VHGRADLLTLLLLQIEVDIALHPISRPIAVFLGDYIDRGPDSKEVVDLLVMSGRTPEMVFLKGNHETFLLHFLKNATVLDTWRQYGGLETLSSYGLKPPINPSLDEQTRLAHDLADAMPESHRRFFQTLKLSFVCGDFIFVHAGLRPLIPIQQQTEDDLLWIRDDFLLWNKEFEKIVVHGHTPVLEPDIRFNRINIDTGAFATGRLTCMTIEAAEIMPLIDVRNWVGQLPDIEISDSDLIRLKDFSQTESVDEAKYAGSRKATFGKPVSSRDVVAAIHVKRLKEDTRGYDNDALALLDPRRQADAS
jgi:serine/threonine protein phosphatase 1